MLWVYKVGLKAPFLIKSSTSSTKVTNDKASPIRLLNYNKDPLSQINVFLFSQSLPLWNYVSNHSLFLDLLLLSPGPSVNCGGGTMKSFMWTKKRKLSVFNALSPFLYHCEHTKRNKRKGSTPFPVVKRHFRNKGRNPWEWLCVCLSSNWLSLRVCVKPFQCQESKSGEDKQNVGLSFLLQSNGWHLTKMTESPWHCREFHKKNCWHQWDFECLGRQIQTTSYKLDLTHCFTK